MSVPSTLALLSALTVVIGGCMHADSREVSPAGSMANGSLAEASEVECVPISGEFRNVGMREGEDSNGSSKALLAEHVFNRYLPEEKSVHYVKLSSDTDLGWMTVVIVGETRREVRFPVSCMSGWHVTMQTRADQYLGEGVTEKNYRQDSFFRQDESGDLVAWVSMRADFRTALVFPSHSNSEGWYRFEPLNDEKHGQD